VAVPLAERWDAEIVCADSRTVYRGMDVGTAKPAADLRQRVPHHLLDVADPVQTFTVADYQRLARRTLAEIRGRGRLPLIVGGTGLYVRAVVDDLTIPAVEPDLDLRAGLEDEERRHGRGYLHARLATIDPEAAAHIHPHNTRRLVRALEVTLKTGRPVSSQQGRRGAAGRVAMMGLTLDRLILYRRVDARVEEQLAAGLVQEVQRLLDTGVPAEAPAMQGLGYKEIIGWLTGVYDRSEAVRLLKRNTRRYAKRQWTWFRRDPRVTWIDAAEGDAGVLMDRLHAIMNATFSTSRRR
jgi:tRNA dimethylallyltransferase